MQLRNAILIALAFDATQEEVDHAHELIDRVAGGIDPSILVSASVNGKTGEMETSGSGEPMQPATATVTLDKNGLPWDERIHSSSKGLNADGTWRNRRGVDAGLRTKVEAELKATVGSAPAPAQDTPAAPTPTPTPTPAAPAPLPGAGLPPMPGAAVPDPAYTALVKFIAENTQSTANPAGKLTDDYIKQVLTHYGVAEGSLQNLAHKPDAIPQVDDWLKQVLAAA